MNDLVNGLRHAHSKGISNSDIKPTNSFAFEDANHESYYKLGDWGGSVKFRMTKQEGE